MQDEQAVPIPPPGVGVDPIHNERIMAGMKSLMEMSAAIMRAPVELTFPLSDGQVRKVQTTLPNILAQLTSGTWLDLPHVVIRTEYDDAGNEHKVQQQTNFVQQLAELNDNLKDVAAAIDNVGVDDDDDDDGGDEEDLGNEPPDNHRRRVAATPERLKPRRGGRG
jgi:hypothetical protein